MNRQSAKKLAAFAIPFCALFLTICSVQPPPSFAFQYLKDDCAGQAAFIYNKLYTDTASLPIAFFGTSHTLQGVNDSLISSDFMPCVNLGYCRFGRDIQYEVFRQALEQKKIHTAVFEITETEASYSHPVYPYLSEGTEVFLPGLLYNQDFYRNRAEALIFRLSYLQHVLSRKTIDPSQNSRLFGYIPSYGNPSSAYLNKQKQEKLKDLDSYSPNSPLRTAELSFSSHYLNKIHAIANAYNCEVFFLYLPAFGNRARNSLDSNFYASFFPTLLPPDSILSSTSNWNDEAHLNSSGANKLSRWICSALPKTKKRTASFSPRK